MDKLKNFRDKPNQDLDMKNATNLAIEKLKQYYPITAGLVYVVATSKFKKYI